jgi:hypothetical protein
MSRQNGRIISEKGSINPWWISLTHPINSISNDRLEIFTLKGNDFNKN